jgi:hypothetical protein
MSVSTENHAEHEYVAICGTLYLIVGKKPDDLDEKIKAGLEAGEGVLELEVGFRPKGMRYSYLVGKLIVPYTNPCGQFMIGCKVEGRPWPGH